MFSFMGKVGRGEDVRKVGGVVSKLNFYLLLEKGNK